MVIGNWGLENDGRVALSGCCEGRIETRELRTGMAREALSLFCMERERKLMQWFFKLIKCPQRFPGKLMLYQLTMLV